jgi:hypothetical protein
VQYAVSDLWRIHASALAIRERPATHAESYQVEPLGESSYSLEAFAAAEAITCDVAMGVTDSCGVLADGTEDGCVGYGVRWQDNQHRDAKSAHALGAAG